MSGFARGPKPPGVKATLADRKTWTDRAKKFATAYEQRLRDGEPILSVDFLRQEFAHVTEKTWYQWRYRYPSFSAHLLWLEDQHGTEEQYRAKYAPEINAADRLDLVEQQWHDLSDPKEIFLRVLEDQKSHERAMNDSGVTWEDFRKVYDDDDAWRARYVSLVGPLPPDLPYFGLLAIDTLLQSALREGKAADAKSLLAKLHDGFRPASQKPAAAKASEKVTVGKKAMEALYRGLTAPRQEVDMQIHKPHGGQHLG